ncbi:MAG TPA: VOC family protein [Mycobacteriales bacterium]|jgi:predicted enzyme related to lactoylglutathione lyase|nr:VOC family protein [Mycobacteriales bacterium]
MGNPVVHFEILGTDPDGLRSYYGSLFGWEFEVGGSTVPEVSEPGRYGFLSPPDGTGIPGGIGGGASHEPRTVFYVGVPDVAAALARAEELGGTRVMGPGRAAGRDLVVAQFTDPEGNLIGLAGPA